MYLIHWIQFGTCEVRRLTQALTTYKVISPPYDPHPPHPPKLVNLLDAHTKQSCEEKRTDKRIPKV